jgi:hypothetical protein
MSIGSLQKPERTTACRRARQPAHGESLRRGRVARWAAERLMMPHFRPHVADPKPDPDRPITPEEPQTPYPTKPEPHPTEPDPGPIPKEPRPNPPLTPPEPEPPGPVACGISWYG